MRVLQIHNYYQRAGGEDQVVAHEAALLRERGHEVVQVTDSNDRIEGMGRLALARDTVWNRSAARTVREEIRRTRPGVVHVHNTFPLLSPAVYHAARAERVPVVQTLHNYRLICPSAGLFRDGKVCEECVGKSFPTPSIRHRCYRGSRAATTVAATMVAVHRGLGTWNRDVTLYIAPTEFVRAKMVQGGLEGERVVVKPNCLAKDPGPTVPGDGAYALFAGRLSPERGIATLLAAWDRHENRVPLRIAGSGPLEGEVDTRMGALAGVECLGWRPSDAVLELMRGARFLVVPSEWLEPCGTMVAIEAFATGLPVIAAGIGSLNAFVADGRTGLHFTAGDPADLASKASWAWSNPQRMAAMGLNARQEYEEKYGAETNYRRLLEIYELAARRFAQA